MDDEVLGAAVVRAERVVKNLADRALREKAFEVVLTRLLVPELIQEAKWNSTATVRPAGVGLSQATDYFAKKDPKTLSQRILALQADGFFGDPKSIGDVREGLKARGWHYPVTTLSGVLQGLIQKRKLRRERVREGRKAGWKYSNA